MNNFTQVCVAYTVSFGTSNLLLLQEGARQRLFVLRHQREEEEILLAIPHQVSLTHHRTGIYILKFLVHEWKVSINVMQLRSFPWFI